MMRRTIHHLRLLQSVLALAIIPVLALTTPSLLRADENPRLIKDVNTLTIEASSLCGQPVVANNIAYFCGGNFVLWRTDGTESGTHPVLDKDGNEFRYPDNLMELNGLLLFTAYGDTGGFIATDGSAAGTRALYDDEGRAIGSPMLPTISGRYLYFFRFNLIREDSLTFLHELWRTDGRHAELVSLFDTRLDPNDMVSVDGELFFTNYEHKARCC